MVGHTGEGRTNPTARTWMVGIMLSMVKELLRQMVSSDGDITNQGRERIRRVPPVPWSSVTHSSRVQRLGGRCTHIITNCTEELIGVILGVLNLACVLLKCMQHAVACAIVYVLYSVVPRCCCGLWGLLSCGTYRNGGSGIFSGTALCLLGPMDQRGSFDEQCGSGRCSWFSCT